MFIGRIKGNVVATRKLDAVAGQKLAVVEPYGIEDDKTLSPTGRALVTIDPLGAGEGLNFRATTAASRDLIRPMRSTCRFPDSRLRLDSSWRIRKS